MPETVTVIYIDTLFLLNAIVNYLLLLASTKVCGLQARRWRLLMGALAGAVYAVLVFLPALTFLLSMLGKAAVSAVMILLSFGRGRQSVRAGLVFWLVSFAFGGCIYAVNLLAGYQAGLVHNGVPYITVNARALVLLSAFFYGVIVLIFKGLARHTRRGTTPVCIRVGDRSVSFAALRDSGNLLTDPVSGRPVMVAAWQSLQQLWPAETRSLIDEENLRDPTSLLLALDASESAARFRLIPYKSVGVEGGFLLAFHPGSIEIGGKADKNLLVALSPTPVGDGTYAGIVNG